VPYNLPEILQDPKKWIFLCEGEKDCSTLAKAGLLASTFGGSSDLPEEALRYFKGRRVFICGDYDKAGYERVRATHDALKNIAKDVRHAWLQEPCQTPEINDVTDWFKHGGSVDKLTAQVKKAGEIQPLPRNPSNTILTYNDILQMTPPKWLVFDYILENSTAMLIAPSGSYKSFTALDLALSVASGKDYHGNIVQQADVLYIAGEGSVGYRARCSAWKENYQRNIDRFYLLPNAVDLLQEQMIDILLEDIDILKLDLGLFVIDTLSRCNSGEENSATDMSRFIQNLDRIRNTTGCTVLFVHHTGKNASLGARGSSAIYASVDTSIECAKQESVLTITCDKQKDAPPFEQRQFQMKEVNFLDGSSLVPILDENPVVNTVDSDVLAKLEYLLSNEGQTKKHKDIPDGQNVINRSRLREECLDLFEGTSNTKNKAFGRVMEKLIATNQILYTGSARSNQWLWLKDENKQQDNQF
tara:strand:- start:5615 stop:7030 length:1416 start_codon:yes stop_codon:yes gene_type:complete